MTNAEFIVQLINLPKTYIGELPVREDICQAVVPSGGNDRVHFTKDVISQISYMIYFRGTNTGETSKRCSEAYMRIRNWNDSSSMLLIRKLPYYVGRDENRRSVFAFSIEFFTGG